MRDGTTTEFLRHCIQSEFTALFYQEYGNDASGEEVLGLFQCVLDVLVTYLVKKNRGKGIGYEETLKKAEELFLKGLENRNMTLAQSFAADDLMAAGENKEGKA